MYRTNKKKLLKRGAAATLVAGVLAGGAATIASASTTSAHTTHLAPLARPRDGAPPGGPGGPFGPPGAQGVVSAVSDSALTITTPHGSVTYTISSATAVREDQSTLSLGDVVVGDHVQVVTSSPTSTAATTIAIELPRVGGKVISVDSTTIVVSDAFGFYRTIAVSPSTTYEKGSSTGTASDVTVGSFISAEGSVGSDHTTLIATSVTIGAPSGAPGAGDLSGPPPMPGA